MREHIHQTESLIDLRVKMSAVDILDFLLKLPGFLYRTTLHCVAIVVCFMVGLYLKIGSFILDKILMILEFLGATVDRDLVTPHAQKEKLEPVYLSEGRKPCQFIDEQRTLENSRFPIGQDVLIQKSKELIETEFGSKKPELLADNFLFVFPVVGPLRKADFILAFSSFKVEQAFPDSKNNFYNFFVDPLEPNRVWFLTRPELVHSGTLNFGSKKIPPTGIKVVPPPQMLSFTFDREGRCYKMTGGYSVDRTVGNTGGLGGLFGIFYAVGQTLPFPEAQPWKHSPQWETFYRRIPQIQNEWKNLMGH